MKKLFIMAAAFCLGISASAQLASEMQSSSFGNAQEISDYNMVGVSYDWTNMTEKEGGQSESKALNGFGVEYIHGFSLSSTLPMYIETGAKVSMGFMSDKETEDTYGQKAQLLRFNVPVSFAWRFGINDKIALTPYAGIDFRVNCLARSKFSADDQWTDWVSYFDSELGDEKAKRFQMGWHLGFRAEYDRVSLGVSGGTDFINFQKDEDWKVQTSNLAVTVGYRF